MSTTRPPRGSSTGSRTSASPSATAREGDRRAILVGLTAEGRELVKGVSAQRQQFFADVLGSLDADERVQLVRLTEKAALALRTRSQELVTR